MSIPEIGQPVCDECGCYGYEDICSDCMVKKFKKIIKNSAICEDCKKDLYYELEELEE